MSYLEATSSHHHDPPPSPWTFSSARPPPSSFRPSPSSLLPFSFFLSSLCLLLPFLLPLPLLGFFVLPHHVEAGHVSPKGHDESIQDHTVAHLSDDPAFPGGFLDGPQRGQEVFSGRVHGVEGVMGPLGARFLRRLSMSWAFVLGDGDLTGRLG
ncbi:uncharacterized protein BCR38DRAFT_420017 [Pseudomassariella vexata]|uniref:Uncharacterized protein n=1 Tax=Pseudomassariella vexata TaxID=1141098 RepID=A0A1Y2EEC9_9PEZI|nr:uncharacterized protein BCR38DRAFT_420017 [Pseudomassariella vexata]ORY69757.1 hypothetical protein BCR38DRAFT_420017 [Pseudomassariella vexata]